MSINDLIPLLEAEDPSKVVRRGFARPHSYRGTYSELGVEPTENVTVGSMLDALKGAIGQTFTAYKGGDYKMSEWSDVYLAEWGNTGEELGPTLLRYMLADVVTPERSQR